MIPPKHKEVDIPDFMKKPQETRAVLTTESVLQESLRHEYHKGIISGWMHGFLTGIIIPLIIGVVLMTLGII